MSDLFIPVILGTDREGRRSEAPAKYMVEQLKTRGIETQLFDPREFVVDSKKLQGGTGELPKEFQKWHDIAEKADGFVIVTPEYNRSIPGVLKILLDELYSEYKYKPVVLCGVSSGQFGGARAVEHLKQICVELSMIVLRPRVYFDKIKETKPEDEQKAVDTALDELAWMAEVMKGARNAKIKNQKSK